MKDYDSWKTRSDFDDKWPPEEEWPEDRKEEAPEDEEKIENLGHSAVIDI